MTTTQCQCGQPARNAYLCRACRKWLARDIGDLPALAHELEVTLTRQDRTQPANDGGKSSEQPLPINLAASDLLATIRSTLVSWSLLLRDEMHAPLPRNRIDNLTVHLLGWLDPLVRHPAADELYDEIRALHTRARKVLQPPDSRRIPVGPCPEVDADDVPCPGEVTAHITDTPVMRCSACDTEWSSQQWLRAGARIAQRKHQIIRQQHMAEAMFGKPHDTIRCPDCGADREGRVCGCGAVLLLPGESLPPRPEEGEQWRVYRWRGTWVCEPEPEQPHYPFGYVSAKAWEARQA